jgi:hypothetical protein
MGAFGRVVILVSLVAAVFSLFAVIGFKGRLWAVVAALVAHGVFDLVHHRVINDPGVPQWWPGFCFAFDVVTGGSLAVLLLTRKTQKSRLTALSKRRLS